MNWVSISSGNGLSPVRRQAITWTNHAGLLSVGLMGTNFSEIRIGILSFLFKKMNLKLSSANIATILPRRRWVNSRVSWSQPWIVTLLPLLPDNCLVVRQLIGIIFSAPLTQRRSTDRRTCQHGSGYMQTNSVCERFLGYIDWHLRHVLKQICL